MKKSGSRRRREALHVPAFNPAFRLDRPLGTLRRTVPNGPGAVRSRYLGCSSNEPQAIELIPAVSKGVARVGLQAARMCDLGAAQQGVGVDERGPGRACLGTLATQPRVLRTKLGAGATRTDNANGLGAKHPRRAKGAGVVGVRPIPGVTALASEGPRAAPPCLEPR